MSSGLSSKSSNSKNKITITSQYDYQRDEILNRRISKITIGLSTLTPKTANIKIFCAVMFKVWVPHYVFPPALYHASVFLHHGSFKNGTLLEYGQYKNDSDPEYKNTVHYWDHDGLRFASMTYQEYLDYVNLHKNAARHFHIFDCQIKHEFTVHELINYCTVGQSWRAKDYSLELHNCQSFVAVVIQELQAYRIKEERNHTYDKVLIPHRILEPLENIENDAFSTIEKVPILGALIGMGKFIYNCKVTNDYYY